MPFDRPAGPSGPSSRRTEARIERLRDFDCSGGFTERLEAGTPLAIPDCALPEAPAAAAEDDD